MVQLPSCVPLQHARPSCPSPSSRVCQVHVQGISNAFQPSHPLLPSSPSAFNLSQHQGLFQRVGCSHQVKSIALGAEGFENKCDMETLLWEIVEDRGNWYAIVHGVAELDTIEQLSPNHQTYPQRYNFRTSGARWRERKI